MKKELGEIEEIKKERERERDAGINNNNLIKHLCCYYCKRSRKNEFII